MCSLLLVNLAYVINMVDDEAVVALDAILSPHQS